MRKIDISPPISPKWKRWIDDCEKTSKKLAESVQSGQKPSFNENLYRRKSIKDEFFFSRESPFYGKCAYCETNIIDFQRGDIEHFRPKAAVADDIDAPVFLRDRQGKQLQDSKNQPIPHPGYYWLAYDWQNLLPSCTICNQATTVGNKKIGKHNRFPVIGQHAQTPHEVDSERPLLINPASPKNDDNPSNHLDIDIETGLMIPLSDRGRMCIEIFGLNLRDQLIDDRKRAIDQAILLLLQFDQGNDPTTIEKIKLIMQGQRSYTMASCKVLAKIISGK